MADVFISYARADRAYARMFAQALEAEGWSVWFDQMLEPGLAFDKIIESELRVAKSVLVLWSRTSSDSDWVRNEAAHGKARNILVPVKIEISGVPLQFENLETVDLRQWQADRDDADWQRVLKRLTGLIGSRDSAPNVVYPAKVHAGFRYERTPMLTMSGALFFAGTGWLTLGQTANITIDHTTLLGAVPVLVLSVVAWLNWRIARGGPHYKKWLDDIGKPELGAAYTTALDGFLKGLARFVGDHREDGPSRFWSAHAYAFCLGAAIVYPALFVFLNWALSGTAGSLGNVVIWPPHIPDWIRRVCLILFVVGLVLFISAAVEIYSGKRRSGFWRLLAATLLWYANAFTIGFASGIVEAAARAIGASGIVLIVLLVVVLAAGLAVALYWALTARMPLAAAAGFAGSATVASTAAGSPALGVLLALAVSGLIVWGAPRADRRNLGAAFGTIASLVILALAGATWGLALSVGGSHASALPSVAALIILLIIVPAVNAPLDWVSLGVSRFLLGQIASGRHRGITALAWAAADVVLAFAFMAASATSIVWALAWADKIAFQWLGAKVVDVRGLLEGIHDSPAAAGHVWIYATVLSTLVWTAIHFALAIFTGCSTVLGIAPVRAFIAAKMKLANLGDLPAQQWIAFYNFARWSIAFVGGALLIALPFVVVAGSLSDFAAGFADRVLIPIVDAVDANAPPIG